MSAVLAILGFGRKIAGWLLGFAQRHPWPVACAAALALAWWQWGLAEYARAGRDKARTALASEKRAREADRTDWRRQAAAAQAAREAAEHKSQEIATDAQTSHDALAADNAALRAYIADRRLRAGGNPAAAPRSTDDLGAVVHDASTTGTLVATDEADLVACDGAYVYAASAYEWARELVEGGLARSASR